MIVGLTSGCFDLFHHSHLLFLERCKSKCDKLIVGVDSDELVRATKGDGRPIHDELHRLNLISSLKVVDAAFILRRIEDLTKIASDFNVSEVYKCQRFADRSWINKTFIFGTEKAELVIIPDIPGMVSTTDIVNKIKAGCLPVPTFSKDRL
jgi:D-beta-D-heptose 7-phosphate kinase/D-beta-D-heptose 1-phosphate adenosyltransferase